MRSASELALMIFYKLIRVTMSMRGIILLIIFLIAAGCTTPSTGGNESNVTNTSNVTPPSDCIGPVCGSDNQTYGTDCELRGTNVTVLYQGECQVEANCSDSDGGLNPEVFGTASKGSESETDLCLNENQMIEYVCDDNSILSNNVMCEEGKKCKDGQCVEVPKPPPPNMTPGCIGTGQTDIYTQENVTSNGVSYADSCADYRTVKEYYCKNDKLESSNNICPSGYGCSLGQCYQLKFECTETDNGNDTSTRGRTVVTKGILSTSDNWDECIDIQTIREYYCLENGTSGSGEFSCGNGKKCVSGRCVSSSCSETDGGKNIYNYGVTTASGVDYEDDCIDSKTIKEYYCYGDDVESDSKNCGPGYICNEDTDKCVEGSVP